MALEVDSAIFRVALASLQDLTNDTMSKEQVGPYDFQMDNGEIVVQPVWKQYRLNA